MARHHNTVLSYLSTCLSYIPTGTCLSYWYMPTLFSYLSTCLSYLSNCLRKLSSCLSYLSTCLSCLARLWPPGAASCRPGKTIGGRAAVGWRHSAPPWPVAELQRSPLVVCGRPCCRLRSPQNPRPCSRY